MQPPWKKKFVCRMQGSGDIAQSESPIFCLGDRQTVESIRRRGLRFAKRILCEWKALACSIVWLFAITAPNLAQDRPVRVMSFNIRYGTAQDGDNHWDKRREFLLDTIRTFQPDLLGTQETLPFQREYIELGLDHYEAVGVGRDDGKLKGEMACLFFDRERFTKLEEGHFWLSPTPDEVGSKGWDAALPRIATWVRLKSRFDPAHKILFLNTHFDHVGKQARLESAKLIHRQLQEKCEDASIVVTGDFNAGSDSDVYQALFAPFVQATGLHDTFLQSQKPREDQDQGTFSGFLATQRTGARIDWIGCSDDWQVEASWIDRTERSGNTPSDHFPVVAILRYAPPVAR